MRTLAEMPEQAIQPPIQAEMPVQATIQPDRAVTLPVQDATIQHPEIPQGIPQEILQEIHPETISGILMI